MKEAMAGLESHADPYLRDLGVCFVSTQGPLGIGIGLPVAASIKMPHQIRMQLTGCSGLCPPPPAGDAGR
jgi:hypothetical protein